MQTAVNKQTDVNKTQTFIWVDGKVQKLRIYEKETTNKIFLTDREQTTKAENTHTGG